LDPRIPDKQYFRIGEVAEIADVEPYVLRFWETEFSTLKPQKSKSNQRLYSRKDVEHALAIRDLLYEEGFTIAGARRKLAKGLKKAKAERGELPHRARAVFDQLRIEVEGLLRAIEE